ncbi:uncharacterized protein AC631_00201 [Debaryomyces fabryi]|uniref:Ubiquitin-like domain-containing protein n=1 Tax=Debaryomyces fabryi TaxID=58627 RepID=A0A0V1Q6Z0_9ASCO|nr:uncharacterized protein AC631_00201 [Debaryomyces fabryi]KSA04122.1 hypothetical protein AC631_00201 [Debaryomyces fabryi]CUM50081.1 unnamed protein product [Debaryomyces fabryi]
MDVPFTIHFDVEQINAVNEADKLAISTYSINVTLDHTIGDIKQLIWKNSQDYSLKPIFLTIKHNESVKKDHERLCDVLQTPEATDNPIFHGFKLIIDYTLFNSPSVPRRDPVEELFDIIIDFEEPGNQTFKIRETLDCTIGVLKDYIVEEKARHGLTLNRESINLILASNNITCTDNELRLSRALKLDVTPSRPVSFKVQTRIASDGGVSGRRRFHIKIDSTISALEQGNNLFEVNFRTTVYEFKQQIIERMDYQSVRRTFFDQVRLYYATQLIENTTQINDCSLYDVLLLNDEILNQNNGIITMNLEVTDSLSGNGGVLSRDFWQDLRSQNRFEFSPNSSNDLRNIGEDENNSHNIAPIEPTRIILEGGVEWNLTGETFEVIQENARDQTHLDQTRRRVLVNQTNLASRDYEFALQVPGESVERKVILNTSQCIIVDNGTHQPYVLLNPSGASLLNSVFRLANNETLIQKVSVLMYDALQNAMENEIPEPQVNNLANGNGHNRAPVAGNQGETVIDIAVDLMRNNIRRWLSTIMRCVFLIYILGINALFIAFWKELLMYGIIFGTFYVLVFAGNDVANWVEEKFHLNRNDNRRRRIDEKLLLRLIRLLHFTDTVTTNIFSILRNELIRTAVDRTRPYEYVFRNEFEQNSLWFHAIETFTNLWKDGLLMLLLLLPSFSDKIYEELEKWRSNEIDDLALEVRILRELTVDAIDSRRQGANSPKFTEDLVNEYTGYVYNDLIQDSSESYTATEDRYQSLLEYYIKLHYLHTDMDRLLANHGPDPATIVLPTN